MFEDCGRFVKQSKQFNKRTNKNTYNEISIPDNDQYINGNVKKARRGAQLELFLFIRGIDANNENNKNKKDNIGPLKTGSELVI